MITIRNNQSICPSSGFFCFSALIYEVIEEILSFFYLQSHFGVFLFLGGSSQLFGLKSLLIPTLRNLHYPSSHPQVDWYWYRWMLNIICSLLLGILTSLSHASVSGRVSSSVIIPCFCFLIWNLLLFWSDNFLVSLMNEWVSIFFRGIITLISPFIYCCC